MRSRTSLALVILIASFVFESCDQKVATNPPTTGAMSGNANMTTRMFERRQLNVSGFNHLAEFIRPDVRERLDQEPTGDTGDVAPPAVSEAPSGEDQTEQEAYSEDNPSKELELEKAKFTWAKKKFGDALVTDPTLSGVIILYADENFYDMGRLTHFVEEGRDIITQSSNLDPGRIQVIYGGYRGTAQVELWIVPAGESMPEVKPEERDAKGDKEN